MTHFTLTPKSPPAGGDLGVQHTHTKTRIVTMFYKAPAQIFENVRHLRKQMTEAEEKLWNRLSKNQLLNHRFRRQHPIGNFITDFYCHKARLVIEVDGKHHGKQDQVLYDAHRTYELNLLGLNVLRFPNAQVTYHIEKVIAEIERALPLNPRQLAGT